VRRGLRRGPPQITDIGQLSWCGVKDGRRAGRLGAFWGGEVELEVIY